MSRLSRWIPSGLLAFCLPLTGAVLLASEGESAKKVTYTKEVVRILQKRCQECHRPGQIGPFSLLDYESAKDWAETIKEVVNERRMPPWLADRSVNKFSNDRSLNQDEINTLNQWIEGGCLKGEESDMPEPRQFTEGWHIGKPDVVLTMNEEFNVPATGTIPYQHFVIPTNFEEDRWVQAVELKAGNPAVVHHIVMFVRPQDQTGQRLRNSQNSDEQSLGFFAALAPGYLPPEFPKGFGKKIPKGSNIVLQMHYTANGTAQADRSSVALVFAREPVHTEIRTRGIFNNFFSIPPGADNHEVKSALRFPQDSIVLSFMPHMHVRGKDFEYVAEYADGRREKVLSVPRWDFNWQIHYELAEPMHMPKGSKLLCTAHFDNSTANKANPDPDKKVTWGDQTWDEMMIGYINYYIPAAGEPPADAGGGK
jgi:hypothetical protein